MKRRNWHLLLAVAAGWTCAAGAWAAPRIDNISLRGVQAGGVTTLVIEGAELVPAPAIHFSAPHVKHTIKDGATPNRLEVELVVEGQCESGIYLLRAGSASGISEPVALGVDNLPQIPFAPQLATVNVALTGALAGNEVLATSFAGKQGQEVLVEVEAQRLGSKLNPEIHVYDARRTQVAFGRAAAALGGDARAAVKLPADGTYTIEIHDALFRGAQPGFFRLKIGEFRYADLAHPLGVQQGAAATFEFASTNLPADARASATLGLAAGVARGAAPAPWPTGVAMLSGSRPVMRVSEHAELVEAPPADKPQELSPPPVAVNGRIDAAGQQDRYRLAVTPGQTLRFDVLARRAGSALDAVLSIQNEQGAELAGNDDRPGTSDPGLDFKVPEGVNAIVAVVRDLRKQGGADFLYRLAVEAAGQPDFAAMLSSDRVLVPRDAAAVVRVRANRAGYGGPIKLNFGGLPAGVTVAGDEIPAGVSQALVTFTATGVDPAQAIGPAYAASVGLPKELKKLVELPETPVTRHQPWLDDALAVAVTTANPITLTWEPPAESAALALGTALPAKLTLARAGGVKGAVRLSLVTTQETPKKKIKKDNQEQEVDDVERTLRFEGTPTIAADAGEVIANILVPGDLARVPYDLAIQAELLAEDNKTVIATATTPARRLTPVLPVSLELAADAVAARAGSGPTGKVIGRIKRAPGFAQPVNVTLAGLPQGSSAPVVTLTGEQTEFAFPLVLAFGAPAGELKDVKVVATSLTDPKNPKSIFNAGEVPLAVVVVPGEKPPEAKPAEQK